MPSDATGSTAMLDIRPAEMPRQSDLVRRLFRDYASALGISLAFQDFESELRGLPGDYAPPAGRLLLAWQGGKAVGCIALRRLAHDTCEMKRLYVSPEARTGGMGRHLVAAICSEAKAAGYRRIRLDTLPDMAAARRLYAAMGFRPIAPYCFNPAPGAVFLERDLGRLDARD